MIRNIRNVKSFPSHKAHRAVLIYISLAGPSARHQFTLPDHRYRASASHEVPVYVQAFAGTHCTYTRRNGQAELTWVTEGDALPNCRRSPIQVLTGLGVD